MRRLIGLVLALAVAPACVHAPPQLSPEAKVGFQVRRVLAAVDTLQVVAIDAEAEKVISEEDARAVVIATRDAAKIARTLGVALEAGYSEQDLQRKLLLSLRRILQELPGHLNPKASDLLAPYIQTISSLLVIYGY